MSFFRDFSFSCFPNCCKNETPSINLIEELPNRGDSKKYPELQPLRVASLGNQQEDSFARRGSQHSLKSVKSNKSQGHQETAIFSIKKTLSNDFIPEALLFSPLEIEKAPKLRLKETKGALFNNEAIAINASGLVVNEEQLSTGGLTFFWCSNSNLIHSSNSILPTTSNELNIASANLQRSKSQNIRVDYRLNIVCPDKYNNYLFMIYYNPDSQAYKIKFHHIMRPSLNTKPDILIKLMKTPIPVIVALFVSFGDCRLLLKTLGNGILEISDIINKKKEVYSPLTTQVVTVGKGKDCTLPFAGIPLLGAIQLSVVYDCFKKQWMLQSNEDKLHPLQIANWFFGIDSYDVCNVLTVKIFQNDISIEVV